MHFAQKLNIRKRVSAESLSVLSVVVLFFFAILSFVKILFTSNLINTGGEFAEKLYDPAYTTVHKFQSCGWDGVRYCAQFFWRNKSRFTIFSSTNCCFDCKVV